MVFVPAEVFGTFHFWDINEIFSNSDGTNQFIELTTSSEGQEFLSGHTITADSDGDLKTYTWIIDSPSPTADTNILLATTSMAAASGFPTPDFIIPDNFFVPTAETITFNFGESSDIVILNGGIPIGGITSVTASGAEQTATPTNFAGETSAPPFGLWETFPSMPLSRADYTGKVVGSKVYLIQGFGAEMNFTEYDSITGNYTELAPAPYSADHSASAAHNGKIYVAGGCEFGNPCSTARDYNITSNTWANLPDMPFANWSSTAQIVGDDFFVLGGNPNFHKCQKYNIPTNSWSTCADLPTGREHLSSAVFDNKIYVINGRGGFPGDATANEVYDPISNSWEILADKPTAMDGGWGGVFNNKIYVIGGGDPLTAVNEWYDPVTDSWISGPDMPTKRHGLVCEPVGPKIYCFGGGLFNEGGTSSIVEVFDANSFVLPPDTESPSITSSGTPSVPENTTTVVDINSTDDNDSEGSGLTYTKTGGADTALFSLNSTTGALSFSVAPDFENPGDVGTDNVYNVQVTVTDLDILTDVQDLVVTVTDVNEIQCESLPTSGDWIINSSCSLENNFTSPANILVQVEAILTIPNGVTLTIPSGNNISVVSGGGILIELGGTVIVVS